MTNYFKDCTSWQEAKETYRKLAHELHPDKQTGSKEAFQELQRQYQAFSPSKQRYEKETEHQRYYASSFFNIIDMLLDVPYISAEICGSWIWIEIDKEHKDQLKNKDWQSVDYVCKFSRNKLKWYLHPKGYRKQSSKQWSMDDIRNAFGSEEVEKPKQNRLSA